MDDNQVDRISSAITSLNASSYTPTQVVDTTLTTYGTGGNKVDALASIRDQLSELTRVLEMGLADLKQAAESNRALALELQKSRIRGEGFPLEDETTIGGKDE